MSRIFQIVIWFAALVCVGFDLSSAWGSGNMSPQEYVLEKCRSFDVVYFGTTHRQPAILSLISDVLPSLTRTGVTHLGLEIGSDQQHFIDAYLQGNGDPARIQLADAIDCPQYRQLFLELHGLPARHRPIVSALDLPVDLYGRGIDRNQWMAMKLHQIVQSQKDAKIFAILGSMHVLHRLEWLPDIRQPGKSVRTLLSQQQPALSMFSIINSISNPWAVCDFSRHLGSASYGQAVDVDGRFKGWKLGLTQYAAIAPAEPWHLIDGIIIHGATSGL